MRGISWLAANQLASQGLYTMEYVSMTFVRVTTVAEKSDVLNIICVFFLSYPVCIPRASYCHLWPLRLHNFFTHFLTNSTTFQGNKFAEHKKWVMIFSTSFVGNIFNLRVIHRDITINVRMYSCEVPAGNCYACQSLIELGSSRQSFRKRKHSKA